MKWETARKEFYTLGTEAKNGANMKVLTRTSFFEFTKARFVSEIQELEEIIAVENHAKVKVNTETQGGAYV